MTQTHIMIYGRSVEDVERVATDIGAYLKKKGVAWKGPAHLPVAPSHEIKGASKLRRSVEDEKYNWLKQISRDGLDDMLVSGNPVLHGRLIRFQPRIGVDSSFLSDIDLSGSVDVESTKNPTESIEMNKAPFSYDPEQDFKTEP